MYQPIKYEYKRILVRIFHLATWPLTVPSILFYEVFGITGVFNFCATLISLIPGMVGQYLRASFYMQTLSKCSYDLAIGFCSFFSHPDSQVGYRVYIGSFSIIDPAFLEDDTLISSRVLISKSISNDSELIRIGKESWVGEGAIIMHDVGEKCLIGAGCVVNRPISNGHVVVGHPMRTIEVE